MTSQLTVAQVRARAADKSFQRGEALYRDDAIYDTVRRGNQIEGCCQGSEYQPYHIRATLSDNDIVDTSCTCPYDFGGDCKHIVALLLTYITEPDKFEERVPVADVLSARSKDELIALIRKMIKRYPDLQALVDRPAPGKTTFDLKSLRKELRRAFQPTDEWGDDTAQYAVESVSETAGEFANAGDWRSASAIYRLIIEEALSDDDFPLYDEGGYFVVALGEVVNQLAKCLEQPAISEDDAERRAIFDTLMDADAWSYRMRQDTIGEEAAQDVILKHAKPSDFPILRARIQKEQEGAGKRRSGYGFSDWGEEAYADFLAEIDALDNVDPDIILQRLRQQGQHMLLFEKLLALGRSDEAIAVLNEHVTHPHDLLRELPILVNAGHEAVAIRLAEKAAQAHYDDWLVRWLLDRYNAHQDWEGCLRWQLRQMEQYTTVEQYARLKATALALGNWESVRANMLKRLEKDNRLDVLTRIYLAEEDWESAWGVVKDLKKKSAELRSTIGWYYPLTGLDLEVAEKSRHIYPERAIPVYERYVRQNIEQRNREAYRQAAAYLVILRELYEQVENEEAWLSLVEGIRAEFKTVRALHDELKKAGL